MRPAGRVLGGRIRRLSAYDRHCLAVERPGRPLHLGVLLRLDRAAPGDPDGRFSLDAARRLFRARLERLPELRCVVTAAPPLGGGPYWSDDPAFDVDHHVEAVGVEAPGDERALARTLETLLQPPLCRDRPLWRVWFLTGLAGDRIAVLFVAHHALADGMTAMRLAEALLLGRAASEPRAGSAAGSIAPTWPALVLDQAARRWGELAGFLRPSSWREAARAIAGIARAAAASRATSASPLNAPVGPRRRLEVVHLDLPAVRAVARSRDCGVNDVLLAVVAGGVRRLLVGRGVGTGSRPRAGVAVTLATRREHGSVGNAVGTLHVPLPVDLVDPVERLPVLAAERAHASASPMVRLEPYLRALARRAGRFAPSLERQRLVNLAVTLIPGPRATAVFEGARVTDLVPLAPLAGNLGLSFVALPYAGTLTVAVRADADAFPDLDRLVAGMEADWARLRDAA